MTHPEEAQQMGKRGRRAVKQRFNWEAEVPKLLDLYRSLGN
jgi:glycosyltransferase involved in cell wall biosynthesis